MIDWVEIPAGDVLAGTRPDRIDDLLARHADLPIERSWLLKEVPAHHIAVPAFVIARTPVTRAQYGVFVRAVGRPEIRQDRSGQLPMSGVSYDDAAAFCAWLTDVEGFPIDLPDEAEWERAARGDDHRCYPWGEDWTPNRANTVEAGIGDLTPVGGFPDGASPFGVLDLAGNVDEWTSSRYAAYPGAPEGVPPTEDWALDEHVSRGGSYRHGRDLARCARRHGLYDRAAAAVMGFRVVRRERPANPGPGCRA
ncbi:MAG TPA: SUMF1/EgtB/PvdO family nonheme iron enzyme [Pseudonocardiaceae bacterium]